MAPKDVYILIPGICDYVTLHDRRAFVDVNIRRQPLAAGKGKAMDSPLEPLVEGMQTW